MVRIETLGDERLEDFGVVGVPGRLIERGLFVAEGRLVVRRLLTSSMQTRSLLVTEPALASLKDLIAVHPSLPVYVVPQDVMNGVTGFNFHRGCLAIGVRPPADDWHRLAARARRLVVLERVGNVDNIGAIFRSAAAFSVDGVLLQSDCGDPLYRKSIRTSMGAALTLPFARVAEWPEALDELRESGWKTVALTPAPTAATLKHVTGAVTGQRTAVVLGHEGDGLTPSAIEACTHRARIPMAGGVDSLNVAAAAAIALYELGSGVI